MDIWGMSAGAVGVEFGLGFPARYCGGDKSEREKEKALASPGRGTAKTRRGGEGGVQNKTPVNA